MASDYIARSARAKAWPAVRSVLIVAFVPSRFTSLRNDEMSAMLLVLVLVCFVIIECALPKIPASVKQGMSSSCMSVFRYQIKRHLGVSEVM